MDHLTGRQRVKVTILKKIVLITNVFRWSADALEDLPVFFQRLKRNHLWSFGFGKNLHKFAKNKCGSKVNLIIDIGANKGQFATMARFCWPKAIIKSFEPDPKAAKSFIKNLGHDKNVELIKIAIGSCACVKKFKLRKNSEQNSFFESATGTADILKSSKVMVDKIDNVVKISKKNIVLLKIDVQGFELNVLNGAKKTLNNITFVLVEISLKESYKNGSRIEDVWKFLRNREFLFFCIMDQYRNPKNGIIEQMDVLFRKI